jgi:mono/diheme cytochrome c family protein
MRKLLSISVILLLTISAVYFSSCNNESTTGPVNNEDSLKKVIERGEYLANHVALCMDCHSKRDFTKYAGPVIPGSEGGGGELFDPKIGLPGMIYGKNITPDSATGIGTWTDAEILRAMTQGISKNGDTLFPIMPYPTLNRMAKDDLLSIIAYIRTLKPIKNAIPARQLFVPIAMVYPGKFLQPSVDGNVRPPVSDIVEYGGYITAMANCAECHSPQTPAGPDRSRMYAGGYVFDLGTNKVVSSNITPDSTTGMGSWTEERFLNKFTTYRDSTQFMRDHGNQNTIMPVGMYAGMKDEDLKAIYAYLRTVPPIKNIVVKFPK